MMISDHIYIFQISMVFLKHFSEKYRYDILVLYRGSTPLTNHFSIIKWQLPRFHPKFTHG